MITKARIRTLARKLAGDTDTDQPFWSDTELDALIEDWQVDLATFMRTPREESTPYLQVINQYEYDLPADWISVIRIIQYNSDGSDSELIYKPESEISALDPNWRNHEASTPINYFIANEITPGTSLIRKFNIYPKPVEALNMLMVYVKVPTPIAADANVPVFPPAMHILAVYYLTWFMSMVINPDRATYYEKKYYTERVKLLSAGRRESEQSMFITMK